MISSPGRLDESLLWLRGMAVEYLVSNDVPKFSGALERLDAAGRLVHLPIARSEPRAGGSGVAA